MMGKTSFVIDFWQKIEVQSSALVAIQISLQALSKILMERYRISICT
jgi:hypothetical protein